MSEGRERDLVLAPNQFIHILDETKGNINSYIGPNKASLGNTEKPVVFNERTKDFVVSTLEDAIQQFRIAPEGWYIILKNPADKQPQPGKTETLIDLKTGRKINIPGPTSMALWPGQMAKVVKGHHLRYNQYLIGRVYDDEAAKSNWAEAVVKTQADTEDPEAAEKADVLGVDPSQLTMGQLIVIKGTDVSFFIPPTGIEILADDEGKYARRAVTLERLEYCILQDEDGNKRFEKGPNVVFPRPTESFLRRKNEAGKVTRKFRAIELNEQMGIYLKVIADHEDDKGVQHLAGDELFLTGKEVRIYYPRPEHGIIRYGSGSEIHYSVAIPKGEGRYILHKTTGEIETIKGPKMLLPDPRESVIVNRVLDPKKCMLMYPGNDEALQHNLQLMQKMGNKDMVERMQMEAQYASNSFNQGVTLGASSEDIPSPEDFGATRGSSSPRLRSSRRKGIVADDFGRKTTFTPPRSITLNTKFQGAVMVNIWTGYAVQVISKDGTRRVELGPKTILLDYDEELGTLQMSSGIPKGSKEPKEDVYLRVRNNKMSDRIEATTKDMVDVSFDLSLRTNFTGEDPELWFEVEDYTKFVSDHIRSIVRNAVKKIGIEQFADNPIDFIRDTILGPADPDKDGDISRPGRLFKENGLHIYDVEVLGVSIKDDGISSQLVNSHHKNVTAALALEQSKRELEIVKETELVNREIEDERTETQLNSFNRELDRISKQAEIRLAQITEDLGRQRIMLTGQTEQQEMLNNIEESKLARERKRREQELELAREQLTQVMEELKSRSEAWVRKASAITPQLTSALQAHADTQLLSQAYENLAPLSVLGNKSVVDIVQGLVKGTKLEGLITPMQDAPKMLTADKED